jgi:hypothetical protein
VYNFAFCGVQCKTFLELSIKTNKWKYSLWTKVSIQKILFIFNSRTVPNKNHRSNKIYLIQSDQFEERKPNDESNIDI